MAELTPMMQQYLETKKEYPDCILFYRLGDFYEMFFQDAETAAAELGITLTGKNCGLDEKAPMCGVPYHAVEGYLYKLVSKGYKVAICEQVEDPKQTQSRGLVKREVTRVVSAGTNLNVQTLDETKNNYICCIAYFQGKAGIATADVTTGDFSLTEVEDHKKILDEINKFAPTEIISNAAFLVSGMNIDDLKERLGIIVHSLEARFFDDDGCQRCLKQHFKVDTLQGLGLPDFPCGTIAAGALLQYLYETQKTSLNHLTHLNPYLTGAYMLLDSATRRNLELTETLREKQKKGSLLGVLDRTKTAMGARTLRSYVEQPLLVRDQMEERLDCIEALCQNSMVRDELREYLQPIYDLERLLGKISYKTANPRDLIAFRNSLRMLAPIKTVLSNLEQDNLGQDNVVQDNVVQDNLGQDHQEQDNQEQGVTKPGKGGKKAGPFSKILAEIDDLADIAALLERSIVEEPPIAVKEGGIIKAGYQETIDSLRNAKSEGKNWLAQLEAEDRERTGIKNLKISYNKIFGYCFEVTKSYIHLVPEDFIRKQTLANAERYFTPRLKELEDMILNAEDKLYGLEYEQFCQIRETIAAEMERIQRTAKGIAALDVLAALSYVAERCHYVRPTLNEKGTIDIKNGRHPVVEQMTADGMFIANDTFLDTGKHCVSVITGPNMAGKSTYMRQTALIVLMAQIGCFVPAERANIGIVDRIFTRVGASDDLASGQSTFMVEMNEVANILRNATPDSLLILDEIGRGTSTFDGLSIAWAVIEHISNRKFLGAKTLFATHYHELTELEGKIHNVNNYCIAVHEKGDDIVFLRKIVKGGADRSYGIQVARLAGVPDLVIDRAREIANQLDDNNIMEKLKDLTVSQKRDRKKPAVYDEVDLAQMSLFDTVKDEDVLTELRQVDISNLTPLDALNTLYRLQNKLNNRWQQSL